MSADAATDHSQRPSATANKAVTLPEYLPPILNANAFREGLASHPDQTFANYITRCCTEGVNIGYNSNRKSLISDNWPSSEKFRTAVTQSIKRDVHLDRKLGPFQSPPSTNFMGSPMGAFEKRRQPGKHRIIHDLSWPPGRSVNDFINPDQFRLHYMSVDDVVSVIQTFGRGARLAKLDLADAFHHIRVRPEDWELLGTTWISDSGDTEYYISTVLPFGLRSSPKLFNDFAMAANYMMIDRGVHYVDHYLDDFITVGAPGTPECQNNLDIMLQVCEDVGFAVNPKKVHPATTELEFLGIIIDTEKMELRISNDRLEEVLEVIQQWRGKRRGKKRELLSLIGKLSFVTRVVAHGRSFLRRFIDTASKAKHLHHYVRLPSGFQADLDWWYYYLEQWNGISMFPDPIWTEASTLDIYTDASNIALSGYYNGAWFVELTDTTQSIAHRELRALVLAAATWGAEWSSMSILFHCDNMSTVQILNSSTSRCADLMCLLRSLLYIAAKYQFRYKAEYINTKDNTIADSLSRLDFYRFWRIAPDSDVRMTSTRPIPLGYNASPCHC